MPTERVSEEPPFTNTGLDFAGPLYVRIPSQSQSKESEKVYVALFSCASTRAVHLELVENLSVPTFLQAFRRFTSRRGLPSTIFTDNAKTFKAASREVIGIFKSKEAERYFVNRGVVWKYIIERAPWHGGFYERMVRSVKRCLKKSIGTGSVTFGELRTLLIEIETTINNRPLTFIYDDEEGLSYALTPSHLIYGRQISSHLNHRHYEIVSTITTLTKRANHQQRILDQFTKQWRKEYLLSLRESAKLSAKPSKDTIKIKIGEIVILRNDSTKRVFWKFGKVDELIPSKDGIIRAAKVRVQGDGRKQVLLRRPIQHLIPLEVRAQLPIPEPEDPCNHPTANNVEEKEETRRARPRRRTVIAADRFRAELYKRFTI